METQPPTLNVWGADGSVDAPIASTAAKSIGATQLKGRFMTARPGSLGEVTNPKGATGLGNLLTLFSARAFARM